MESITAHYSQVYDSLHYDGILCEIMVYHGFKSCSIITNYMTSRLGNSMYLALLEFSATLSTLGSDMGYCNSAMHRKPCTTTTDKNI
jgi:hypothetical protein